MERIDEELLIEEASDFLHWLAELGVSVWKDMSTMELVFSPKAQLTKQAVAEAYRLRDCLAALLPPGVQVTTDPYSRSRN